MEQCEVRELNRCASFHTNGPLHLIGKVCKDSLRRSLELSIVECGPWHHSLAKLHNNGAICRYRADARDWRVVVIYVFLNYVLRREWLELWRLLAGVVDQKFVPSEATTRGFNINLDSRLQFLLHFSFGWDQLKRALGL